MKLFSATYTLDTYQYMEDTFRGKSSHFRVIWANNVNEAIELIRAQYPMNEYSTYCVPVNIEINEALGNFEAPASQA